jgi:hypothetical protein
VDRRRSTGSKKGYQIADLVRLRRDAAERVHQALPCSLWVGSRLSCEALEKCRRSAHSTYSVHDIEDFHRCDALPWQRVFGDKERIVPHALNGESRTSDRGLRLDAAYARLHAFLQGMHGASLTDTYEGTRQQREQLRSLTPYLINRYMGAVSSNTDRNASKAVVFDTELVDEVAILKQITRDYIIASPTLAA